PRRRDTARTHASQQPRKVTPGPVEVGSRYHQVRTVPARREESLEGVELEPVRRLTVHGTLNTFPARLDYDLDAEGDTTVLTNTVELSTAVPLNLVPPVATR